MVGQPGRHDSSLCGNDDCRYRSLYEGTQTSLADMAAKQSAALRSLTAVKRRVSDLLKQHFPNEHARAERSLAGRLADAEDEVLMAYLEDLVSGAVSPLEGTRWATPLGADLLRESLRMAGYPIGDDDDLAAWAAAVNRHQARVDRERSQTAGEPVGVVGSGGPGADWERLIDDGDDGDLVESPSVDAGPVGPGPGELAEPVDLGDLFGDGPGPAIGPPAGGNELDDLFGDGEPVGQSTGDGDEPVDLDDLFGDGPGVVAGPPVGGNELDDLFGDGPAGSGTDGRDELVDLGDLFDDGPSAPDHGAGRAAVGVPPAPVGAVDLDDLFGDEPSPPAPVGATTVAAGAGDLDDLFGDDGTVAPGTGPVSAEALTIPIRPELVATNRSRRSTRSPRRRADRPDPRRDLDDGDDPVPVEADVAVRIEAAVAIPRPVFSSELVAVAGSQEVLDAWMQDMYDLGAQAPVRFVIAKTRHRFLGTLVLPDGALRDAAVEFDNSWWAQVMSRYHGSALYELAVLLSRVGDQVQSSELADTCARFRLDTQRGLVGAVVHLGGGLEDGSEGRKELADAIDAFRRERFTLLAVLNIHAGAPALDALVGAVRELAEDTRWSPAYPVVATNTWEWAANSGRTSTLVLGG